MPQTSFVWIDGDQLGAIRSDQSGTVLVIDLAKSDPLNNLFFVTDITLTKECLTPYNGNLPRKLMESVNKFFDIIADGGILYTEDTDGKRYLRITGEMMSLKQKYLLRLQFGVEKQWLPWQLRQDVGIVDYVLNK